MDSLESLPEANIRLGDVSFSLRLHPAGDKMMNPAILNHGIWEPTETAVFKALLREADTVLDIGANIGWYSMVAASLIGDKGLVVAVEPEPAVGSILEENVRRNGFSTIKVLHAAVADRISQAGFVSTPHHVGDHHLALTSAEKGTTTVEVVTVDEIQRQIGRSPSLIKMDTQGAELAILRGMEGLLKLNSAKPILISEFWPYGLRRLGGTAGELLRIWEQNEYIPYVIDDRIKGLRRTSFGSLRHRVRTDLAADSMRFIDLVLVPRDDSRRVVVDSFVRPLQPFDRIMRDWVRPVLATAKRELLNRLARRNGASPSA